MCGGAGGRGFCRRCSSGHSQGACARVLCSALNQKGVVALVGVLVVAVEAWWTRPATSTPPHTPPTPTPIPHTHLFLTLCLCLSFLLLQVSGVTDAGLSPRPLRSIAVLGGGLMGSGIATALLLAGLDVTLKEVNAKFLEVCYNTTNASVCVVYSCASLGRQAGRRRHHHHHQHHHHRCRRHVRCTHCIQAGVSRVRSNLASRVKKGRMSQEAADATLRRLTGTLEYSSFGA